MNGDRILQGNLLKTTVPRFFNSFNTVLNS